MIEKLARFLEYLQQDGDNVYLLVSLAEMYRKQGDESSANAYQEKTIFLLENRMNDYKALSLLAKLYFEKGECQLAEQTAKRSLHMQDNVEAEIILTFVDMNKDIFNLKKIKALQKKSPEDCRVFFALGIYYSRNCQFSEAEKSFLKASILEPTFLDNWIALAWCRLFMNKLSPAEQCFKEVLCINPKNAEGLGGIALIKILRMEKVKGKNIVEAAKKIDDLCFSARVAELMDRNKVRMEL